MMACGGDAEARELVLAVSDTDRSNCSAEVPGYHVCLDAASHAWIERLR